MKKKLETWLRKIFNEEVAKIKSSFTSELTTIETSFNKELSVVETSFASGRDAYVAKVETVFADIQKKMTIDLEAMLLRYKTDVGGELKRIGDSISKDLDHWRADAATVKADHELRKVK